MSSSKYGSISDTAPIWLSEVQCFGNESNIAHCHNRGWGSHDCSHDQDVAVSCSSASPSLLPLAVNITGGVAKNEGRITVRYNGQWGRVCSQYWDIRDVMVVCKHLGFIGAKSMKILNGSIDEPVWMDEVHCVGTEQYLWNCLFSGWGHSNGASCFDVYVICDSNDYDIRLVGGANKHSGQVQVFYSGVWGSVCGTNWTLINAHVVCQQLGYKEALSTYNSTDKGLILMDEVYCEGSENRLVDCSFRGWGYIHQHCSHGNYSVGVVCGGMYFIYCMYTVHCFGPDVQPLQVRLVQNSTLYEGLVEVYYYGRWGYICGNYWDDFEAQV